MSRKSVSRPSTANGPSSAITIDGPGTTNGSPDDICPVCKTIRYLNKDMVFLINPECYHPMCSNCVNRLFAGPNQCPYAGCHKTLRRKDFRRAFFGDLAVEREVDIRRRVAAVFNQAEDDFESLDAYNEYLEKVEALTMDLVSGAPPRRKAAQAELARWEAEHRAEIERNRRRGERADELGRAHLAAERDAARVRRLDAQRQDEDERRARLREREADLDSLTAAAPLPGAGHHPDGGSNGGDIVVDNNDDDPDAAAVAAGRVLLRRRGQHHRQDLLAAEEQALLRGRGGTPGAAGGSGSGSGGGGGGGLGLTIRGLKDKRKTGASGGGSGGDADGSGNGSGGGGGGGAADVGPYDPFEGLDPPPSRFRVRAGAYRNPWLQGAREHTSHVVGGYDVHEYCARALFDAFSGLAVFVDDEKATGQADASAAAVATLGASLAAMGADNSGGAAAATTGTGAAGGAASLPVKMEVDTAS